MSNGWASEKIGDELEKLRSSMLGIDGAAVVNMDGLIMVRRFPQDIDEDSVAAMAAAILSLGENAVENVNKGLLDKVLIEGKNGYIFLTQAGKEAMLTIITTKEVKLGMLFFQAKRTADQIEKQLESA